MNRQQAIEVVARVLRHWDGVETVQFFGGEPLLNPSVIDAAAEAFHSAVMNANLRQMPHFHAVTNGTIVSPDVLSVLRRWAISLTVSWDGPPNVQDVTRPIAGNHERSSERVAMSLERFSSEGIRFGIECTYSHRHSELGMSIIELMDFFHAAVGPTILHITPAAVAAVARQCGGGSQAKPVKDHPFQSTTLQDRARIVSAFRAAARYSLANMFRGSGPTMALVNTIVSRIASGKGSHAYCGAFHNELTVNSDGTMYPCFMFAGDLSFSLGNIFTDDLPTTKAGEVFQRYDREFSSCNALGDNLLAPLISGCIASDFIMTGSLGGLYWVPLYEAIAEECIMELAHHT